MKLLVTLCWVTFASSSAWLLADELPDIRSVSADLELPMLNSGPPAAGQRTKLMLPAWKATDVYHVLHLPKQWRADSTAEYPVLVEWAGNGGYSNTFGDRCHGRPEGCRLGYGLAGGEDVIWLCLPYLNAAGTDLSLTWWGDPPDYDPQPTLRYCRAAVEAVCREFHGDRERVVLCGFSRGAIACNYLGLHDDHTAKLWCGFFAHSHYDGVRRWPFPDSDRASAGRRLERLGSRPQFVCSEGTGVDVTRDYLRPLVGSNQITFVDTGFRNHSDAWILRPCPARDAARQWLVELLNPTAPK